MFKPARVKSFFNNPDDSGHFPARNPRRQSHMEDVHVIKLKNPEIDQTYIEKRLKEFEKAPDKPLVDTWKKS